MIPLQSSCQQNAQVTCKNIHGAQKEQCLVFTSVPLCLNLHSSISSHKNISCEEHVNNKEVCATIQQAIVPQKDPMTIIKRHKLQSYGYISQSSGLVKTILQSRVKGDRRHGKRWGNIRTGLDFVQVPSGRGEQGK